MPAMNISLTPEMASFIEREMESGLYASASELVDESLRTLEREREAEAKKLGALREAVQAGLDDVEAGRLSTRTVREIAEEVLRQAKADAA